MSGRLATMAVQKYLSVAKRLQNAINTTYDMKIIINISQWYSEKKKCLMNQYVVRQVFVDEEGKKTSVELYKTYSTIRLTLFLRDYWFELNGWEVPTDNQMWEEIKKDYGDKKDTTTV